MEIMMQVFISILLAMNVFIILSVIESEKENKKQTLNLESLKKYLKIELDELEVNKIILTQVQRMCLSLLQKQERRKENITEQIKKQLDHVSSSDATDLSNLSKSSELWDEVKTTREAGETITKIKKNEDTVFIVN